MDMKKIDASKHDVIVGKLGKTTIVEIKLDGIANRVAVCVEKIIKEIQYE